jgi:hypothetical protein
MERVCLIILKRTLMRHIFRLADVSRFGIPKRGTGYGCSYTFGSTGRPLIDKKQAKFSACSLRRSPGNGNDQTWLTGDVGRKTERQKDRKTERQKDRKTERQKDRKTERQNYSGTMKASSVPCTSMLYVSAPLNGLMPEG